MKYIIKLLCFLIAVVIALIIFENYKSFKTHEFYEDSFFQFDSTNSSRVVKVGRNEKAFFKNNVSNLLNLRDFAYEIHQTSCNSSVDVYKKIKYLWIITSYAGDVSKRSTIRQAYSNQDLLNLGIRRIFLLGKLNADAKKKIVHQNAIVDEAKRFQDILQGNFIEAYRNLTYKHLMGLRWVTERCGENYRHILKMDDDIVVNLYEVNNLLKNNVHDNRKDEPWMMGYILNSMIPVRNAANKWYVSYEEFPKNYYPSFLSGWFYIINMPAAKNLVNQMKQHSDYFWIDDVFVTGILREEAGITKLYNIKNYFTSDYRFLKCCFIESHPKYKCDYIVGPDGADPNILLKFQKFSESCYKDNNCLVRPDSKHLDKTCILNFNNEEIESGNAEVKSLPLG